MHSAGEGHCPVEGPGVILVACSPGPIVPNALGQGHWGTPPVMPIASAMHASRISEGGTSSPAPHNPWTPGVSRDDGHPHPPSAVGHLAGCAK